MEIISYEDFQKLEWYSTRIYFRKEFPPNLLDRTDYYEVLLKCVKPLLKSFNWIKCYHFTHYFEPGKPDYHINLRIGTKGKKKEFIKKAINEFLENLSLDLLRSPKPNSDLEKDDKKIDKKKYCLIDDGNNDETYYWFVMHWYTGCEYFLKVLENGYDKLPALAGVPHLQWNLMGFIVPDSENSLILKPEAKLLLHPTKEDGLWDIRLFCQYLGIQDFPIHLPYRVLWNNKDPENSQIIIFPIDTKK
ncbi:MAG: hypothetical protein GF308_14665 [Candidatus Heimdallarchaeota archaeon]|nr:hypothetical protein [Candidatus Heimdallarchaeota archaeon]